MEGSCSAQLGLTAAVDSREAGVGVQRTQSCVKRKYWGRGTSVLAFNLILGVRSPTGLRLKEEEEEDQDHDKEGGTERKEVVEGGGKEGGKEGGREREGERDREGRKEGRKGEREGGRKKDVKNSIGQAHSRAQTGGKNAACVFHPLPHLVLKPTNLVPCLHII